MKVYISSHDCWAAKYVAGTLKSCGVDVVSTWHTVDKEDEQSSWTEIIAANNDPEIRSADCLVLISSRTAVPGGKFVEAGMMLGLNRPVFVLGRIENKMLYHPLVKQFDTVEQILLAMVGRS